MDNTPRISPRQPKSPYTIVAITFAIVWLSTMGIAFLGLKALVNPQLLIKVEKTTDAVREKKVNPTKAITTREQKSAELSEHSNSPENNVSIYTFILVLLVCSGCSLLMTYALRSLVVDKPLKIAKKVNKLKIKPQNRKISQKVLTKSSSKVKPKLNPYPQKSQQTKSPAAVINRSEPVVTVISAQETTPVETKEPSLAEILDLRKRRSLISMMHDN